MARARIYIWLVTFFLGGSSFAGSYVSLEGGPTWQSRNDVGIPSTGGTRFSLLDAGGGPFVLVRGYVGHEFNERHGVRLLFAPLSVNGSGTYGQNIAFNGQNFTAGVPIETTYQFNSYRLTYRYAFYLSDTWKLYVGFTGKIRDAKVALRQGAVASESVNVGFVPLLHFAATYRLSDTWAFILDMDGLAAPQGRAFDVSLQVAYTMYPWLDVSLGYRTVEGGAENDTVFTFAWLHYATAGATFRF